MSHEINVVFPHPDNCELICSECFNELWHYHEFIGFRVGDLYFNLSKCSYCGGTWFERL